MFVSSCGGPVSRKNPLWYRMRLPIRNTRLDSPGNLRSGCDQCRTKGIGCCLARTLPGDELRLVRHAGVLVRIKWKTLRLLSRHLGKHNAIIQLEGEKSQQCHTALCFYYQIGDPVPEPPSAVLVRTYTVRRARFGVQTPASSRAFDSFPSKNLLLE
jgi:hypothetical protein